jgi:hypothetical protein
MPKNLEKLPVFICLGNTMHRLTLNINAQASGYWDPRVADLKIIHFTQKKGWQCQQRYDKPEALDSKRLEQKIERWMIVPAI